MKYLLTFYTINVQSTFANDMLSRYTNCPINVKIIVNNIITLIAKTIDIIKRFLYRWLNS